MSNIFRVARNGIDNALPVAVKILTLNEDWV
jgi:hypothetical protein